MNARNEDRLSQFADQQADRARAWAEENREAWIHDQPLYLRLTIRTAWPFLLGKIGPLCHFIARGIGDWISGLKGPDILEFLLDVLGAERMAQMTRAVAAHPSVGAYLMTEERG